jgi:hemolysin III
MTRTKLCDRELPDYTRGEEIFNMVSHIVGGALGVAATVLCVTFAALRHNPWGVVGGAIFGASMILLYTMSSVYHGLRPNTGKKVMQVLDHCTIYLLIAGTYTPMLLCAVRPVSPAWAWALFGIVLGLGVLGIVFTAIDLKSTAVFSMICYMGMGWCIVLALRATWQAIGDGGMLFLFLGGAAYTLGAVLYGIGSRLRYFHSVFHLFVLAGSVLHFFCIFLYVI